MKVFRLLCVVVLLSLLCCPLLAQGNAVSSGAANPNALAPGIKASALWDGRDHVDFEALNNPTMLKASQAKFLGNDEYVLGLTINGESRAYPTRLLAWHHVVNDKVGKTPDGKPNCVSITYCIVCNSGIRFDSTVNGKPLKLEFFGLYNGVMTMYDHDTNSVWLQITGQAIRGPLRGATLTRKPLLDTTWREWKRLHPDTLVMAPSRHYRRFYDPNGTLVPRGYDGFPTRYFRRSLTHQDNRLPLHELTLAVTVPQTNGLNPARRTSANNAEAVCTTHMYRAYPVTALKKARGVVNDTMGTMPLAVFFAPESEAAVALSRVVDGRILTFETRKSPAGMAYFDCETGTRWSLEGQAEAGPLAGKSLARLDSHMSEWYGWVSYFPQTSIYGRADTPTSVTARKNSRSIASMR